MKMLIDITPEAMDDIKNDRASRCFLQNKILNGKLLPKLTKRHGRLIDADKLVEAWDLDKATKYDHKNAACRDFSYSTMMMYEIAYMIDDAPTVIEADKEEEV